MGLDDLTEEQRDLFKKISINLRDVEILETEIQGIYDSIENGVYHFSDGSRTLCGNEGDAEDISKITKFKLEDVKEETKKYFIQAVKLGMQDLGIIKNNYETYVGKPLPENIGPELRASYKKMNLKFVIE